MNGRHVNLNKSKKEINFMKYKISMAPMEGLTGYVYRRAHHAYFAPLDTYYTPFISNKKLGIVNAMMCCQNIMRECM